jgi:hypothetical protein
LTIPLHANLLARVALMSNMLDTKHFNLLCVLEDHNSSNKCEHVI